MPSRQGFFSSGFTTAALNEAGKIPLEKHRLIIWTNTLINCSECCMTIFVLKGSNEHVVWFIIDSNSWTSDTVVGVKLDKREDDQSNEMSKSVIDNWAACTSKPGNSLRMSAIFVTK